MTINQMSRTAAAVFLSAVIAITTAVGASATPVATSVATQIPSSVGVLAYGMPSVSGWCSNGRCQVHLSKAETKAMGNGRIPPTPWFLPWQIKAAYTALAWGHVWIAKQYGNKNWCSAFLLSTRPWENQGYTGYRC